MDELKQNKKLFYKSLLVAGIYFVLTFICAMFHEVWCDEAQVWMLAKHLSVPELLKHLVNEGHPSPFYLMVMPFAKLTNHFIFQKLICLFFSTAAIFLLWRYSKFNNLAKIIITFSAPFIYYFPVVARSYSLVAFIVFSLAILYKKQEGHPILYSLLIAFCANTHAIMFAFAGLLGLDFSIKQVFLPIKNKTFDKKYILPFLIIVFGLLALVAQLAGTTQSNVAITYYEEVNHFETFIRTIMLFAFNSFDEYFLKVHLRYFTPYTITMFFLTVGTYFMAFYSIFKSDKKLFSITFLAILFHFLIYIFIYSNFIFPTRIYCAYVILLFAFWIIIDKNDVGKSALSNKKWINIIVSLMFALTFINGFKSYYGDIVFDYTGSKRTANFIKNNFDKNNSIIYIDDMAYGLPLAFYINPDFEIYGTNGKPIKYMVWKDEYILQTKEEYVESFFAFLRKSNKSKDLYMLTKSDPYSKGKDYALNDKSFELLYISPYNLLNSETVKIWKYKK